jgi:FixJ family two-component response regulator
MKPAARAPQVAIIDDDASVRDAIGNFVRALGYASQTYASAEVFIESGQLPQTGCVIADVHMPGMSGIDLLRHLTGIHSEVPVLLMTAFPQDATRKIALRNGAIGYLAKPLAEDGLVTCLERAVGPGV